MEYKLFLYRTTGVSVDAPCVRTMNKALDKGFFADWAFNDVESCIENFQAQTVKVEIEKHTTDEHGNRLCEALICNSPEEKKEYICVISSYSNIHKIIDAVYQVARENELVLYDACKRRAFYEKLYDEDFVQIKQRMSAIRETILRFMQPVYCIRKLGFFDGEFYKYADFSVTLRKKQGVSFAERVESFYRLLKTALVEGETLDTKNEAFVVHGRNYWISFSLEAYGKSADRIGYISYGNVCTQLMHRMSCETAFRWAKNNLSRKYENFGYCMYKLEMVRAFENPAERFVEGINIKKREAKEPFHVAYNGNYVCGFAFSVLFPGHETGDEVSILRIDEDEALPLLKIISEFYPYMMDRYYDNSHLPVEMMQDIVERMKEIRRLVLHETYCDELRPYIVNEEAFSVLIDEEDENDKRLYEESRIDFLYKHRYEAVRIYDIFIDWIENQIDMYYYTGSGLMFNIEGL